MSFWPGGEAWDDTGKFLWHYDYKFLLARLGGGWGHGWRRWKEPFEHYTKQKLHSG
jgi:hypothetical protein